MPEALTLRWRGADGEWYRLQFVPTADGIDRVESVWTGCTWRTVGHEPVTEAAIEAGEKEVVIA